jgi:hypothetical protein
MKVKYIESVIVNLPDFNGSIANKGGSNFKQHIHWFKTDANTDFIGLNGDESLGLLNLIKSRLETYLIDSEIKEIDINDIPTLPLYSDQQIPCDYDLSKIVNCKQLLGFEVKGFIPDLYEL